jgi:hypothetical protein
MPQPGGKKMRTAERPCLQPVHESSKRPSPREVRFALRGLFHHNQRLCSSPGVNNPAEIPEPCITSSTTGDQCELHQSIAANESNLRGAYLKMASRRFPKSSQATAAR